MGEIRNNLKKNLSYYLDLMNVSQKTLSEKLNVSQAAVTNWVKGKNSPDIETVSEICDFLNIKMSDLLGENKNINKLDEKDNSLISKYNQLNELGQSKLMERLDELLELPKYRR
ncbi:helix-turn-helix domain-containing protein [Porcipelethomonas ammoniilytica]|uniref:helix-turn-helix domain-containing protein n=1 Tax=Porcipelethomonas ammoniilytica TaxID=2981722 RepID=UPI00082217FB|nr:helix-turn-helix transcriptional regulator [Porcipelethomonas ammoniilytica]MCU6720700.1 helix-turn-helix domain-containing protein [Porcipelethomonas ammoniilytica]SCJ22174.1 Helix-turn-helix [uncultured Ruminococcus sp.]